jgi:23S rRNA (guanine2445-N2)-methyltransferase / 23S rRNA (guanine2069-N7)-methyltransferase
MTPTTLFATSPAPLATLLAAELTQLGAVRVRVRGAGVEFAGDLALAYRACLWSRLASRVLLPLARFEAADGDALYAAARAFAWEDHLRLDTSFAVDCTVRRAHIGHSHYAALRVKDAIVDRFREQQAARPDVDTRSPDIRVHLHLRGSEGRLALDLSGDSLHRRGYRTDTGPAPVRETLAAAVLAMAGWPECGPGAQFLDPLCGSGTLLIEAAMMAGDIAPGLARERFGFLAWGGHDRTIWARLLDEAHARRARGLVGCAPLRGSDRDAAAVEAARRNAARAGLTDHVHVEVRDLASYLACAAPAARGLLATNPPYGTRLDDADARHCRELLRALSLGPLRDWAMALLLPEDAPWPAPEHGRSVAVTNGALPCRIHVLGARDEQRAGDEPAAAAVPAVDTRALANRIAKNQRRLTSWLRREAVSSYRVYDADLPDFALAVDLYDCGADGRWAHVQEYAPPPQIDPMLAAARRDAALAALPAILDVPHGQVVFKTRQRQRGARQYPRQARREQFLEVDEYGARLLINLHDHLDTGLFLDHRPLRHWLREHARGARFLNLFAYTGAATVQAALGGAKQSVSVDLSAPYLAWAERNLALNGFAAPLHRVARGDCLQWLLEARAREAGSFDLVFVDPPTFSNSKRMAGTFDVQRDHVALLEAAAALLSADGTLVFSTNRRGFRLDVPALAPLQVHDWTAASIPPDFSRPAAPHRCWMLRHRTA